MMNKRGIGGIALVVIFVAVVIGIAVYFTFFFHYTCDTLDCYTSHQRACSRTVFVYDKPDITWKYTIQGQTGEFCRIDAVVLQIKQGKIDLYALEGKDMSCELPFGSLLRPEEDIQKCHGILKEELQNIIIQNLHQHIIENLGKIEENLNKAV